MGNCLCPRLPFLGRIPIHLQVGWRKICPVAHGLHVRIFEYCLSCHYRYSMASINCRISFQLIMVIIYPTVIQPMFNKLSPLAAGDLRSRIEALASKLKFPLKHLYEIDGSKRSSHSNAYFFGLPWVYLFLCLFKHQFYLFVFRVNTLLSSIPSFNKANLKKSKLFSVCPFTWYAVCPAYSPDI